MGLREFFLWQLEQEASASRVVIERIPEEHTQWKPHTAAPQLGELATLVAATPGLVALMIGGRVLNVNDELNPSARQSTPLEWRETLTTGLERSRRALEETTEEHLLRLVRFRRDGLVVNEGPRYVMISEFAFTRQAAHRGRLTLYLEMLEAEASIRYPVMLTEECGFFHLQTSVAPFTFKPQPDPACALRLRLRAYPAATRTPAEN